MSFEAETSGHSWIKIFLFALLIQAVPDHFTPMLIRVPKLCPQQHYRGKKKMFSKPNQLSHLDPAPHRTFEQAKLKRRY